MWKNQCRGLRRELWVRIRTGSDWCLETNDAGFSRSWVHTVGRLSKTPYWFLQPCGRPRSHHAHEHKSDIHEEIDEGHHPDSATIGQAPCYRTSSPEAQCQQHRLTKTVICLQKQVWKNQELSRASKLKRCSGQDWQPKLGAITLCLLLLLTIPGLPNPFWSCLWHWCIR